MSIGWHRSRKEDAAPIPLCVECVVDVWASWLLLRMRCLSDLQEVTGLCTRRPSSPDKHPKGIMVTPSDLIFFTSLASPWWHLLINQDVPWFLELPKVTNNRRDWTCKSFSKDGTSFFKAPRKVCMTYIDAFSIFQIKKLKRRKKYFLTKSGLDLPREPTEGYF